jgi:EAL domain-containing protein (putative c-di-GMP-specific phosphodiesterase class I)
MPYAFSIRRCSTSLLLVFPWKTNIEDTIEIMNALGEIGVQFSLDDFGTGYSSLQYLKKLPLTQLKIDQSFVRDIASDKGDQAIVLTIVAMATSLNLSVIAEGVETEEQLQLLSSLGCSNYQGYLFSRPLPLENLDILLRSEDSWKALNGSLNDKDFGLVV